MGFEVAEFEYNNYKYTNTYHRVGILKRDKARRLMSLILYVYKDKATRDESPLNNFLVLNIDCSKSNFCKYFESDFSIEKQAYLYLKNIILSTKTYKIDYTDAKPVFETEEQQAEFDAYLAELEAKEQALLDEAQDDPMDIDG